MVARVSCGAIDTRNTLFIAGGAFAGLETILGRRPRPAGPAIGFHSVPGARQRRRPNPDPFEKTRPEDLRHFGPLPEFIGRCPVITALQALDEATLIRVLTEPKNAPVKHYQQSFSHDRARLEFEPAAFAAIANRGRTLG